jgi:hypothetical protein
MLQIQTPAMQYTTPELRCQGLTLKIAGREFSLNPIVSETGLYDLMLGLEWLTTHNASINCPKRQLVIKRFDIPDCVVQLRKRGDQCPTISATCARRLIETGCPAYLITIMQHHTDTTEITSVPVVSEYADIIPQELPGVPPYREIEFLSGSLVS